MEYVIQVLEIEEGILLKKISEIRSKAAQQEVRKLLRQVKSALKILQAPADKFDYMKGYNQALKDLNTSNSIEIDT